MYKVIKVFFILFLSLFNSNASSKNVGFEDWSGLYLPKSMYDNKKIIYPDFQHFFKPEHDYILITNWKDKLILQSRISTEKPLRFGYFDSEIKYPFNSKQTIIENGCKIELNLEDNKLIVKMNSSTECTTRLDLSGEYIKFNTIKDKIDEGKLFLGKFNNDEICDKATQLQWNNVDLEWSRDEDLKEFIDEAKKRKLDCKIKPSYTSFVLACLWGKPNTPEYCEELKDIRGPYSTNELCKKRVFEIANEIPSHRPHMQPRGFRCVKNYHEDDKQINN